MEATKGSMVIFHDILPAGDVDPMTSHLSCPVKQGEKVVVSRFIRQDTCHLNKFFSWRKWNGNVWCEDDHRRCASASYEHCLLIVALPISNVVRGLHGLQKLAAPQLWLVSCATSACCDVAHQPCSHLT